MPKDSYYSKLSPEEKREYAKKVYERRKKRMDSDPEYKRKIHTEKSDYNRISRARRKAEQEKIPKLRKHFKSASGKTHKEILALSERKRNRNRRYYTNNISGTEKEKARGRERHKKRVETQEGRDYMRQKRRLWRMRNRKKDLKSKRIWHSKAKYGNYWVAHRQLLKLERMEDLN